MHKGFIQLGNSIFVVLSIVVFFAAGYLYFFSKHEKIVTRVVAADFEQKAQIKFIHPVYQYSLDLPYSWKGKYRVLESENQTNFWYVDELGHSDLVFSIRKQSIGDPVALVGESKKLVQSDGFFYILITPERLTEALSSINGQMRREVFSISKTFSLIDKNKSEREIIEALANNLPSVSSSTIKFSAFEIIATQENSSTTEYYIWFLRRQFTGDSFRLRDWPIESLPAFVAINKNNQIVSLKIPRKGVNFTFDLKKLFPDSVLESAIFKESSVDHGLMLDKISGRLDEMVSYYFGLEPTLTRVGYIEDIKMGLGGVNMKVFLAESAKLSASSTYVISNINKTASQFFISSSTPPLSLPEIVTKNKLGRVVASSTSQVVPLSDWQFIFNRNSTSTWRKKPFWFDLVDGQVLRVYPVN